MIESLRLLVFLCCISWILFRVKKKWFKRLISCKDSQLDVATLQTLERLSSIGLAIIIAFISLPIFGLDTVPLVTVGGIGAASFGFAAKDVIANFFSGLVLHLNRSFKVGEEIRLPEKGLQGVVEEIGWFRTSIRDGEKMAMYLPNNYFSTAVVINFSRITHRRFSQVILVPFSAYEKLPDLVRSLRGEIVSLGSVDASQPVDLWLAGFGEYALQLQVEFFLKETDKHKFRVLQQELLFLVQRKMEFFGVEFQLPIQELKEASFVIE